MTQAQAKSFANLVTTTRSGNMFLVSGGKDKYGREAWYFISVEPFKASIFQKEIKKGKINLLDYGTILESGFGKTPPEEAKRRIKEKYNFTAE